MAGTGKDKLPTLPRSLGRHKGYRITGERVLLELARIAFCDPRKLFEGNQLKAPSAWDVDTAASIASFKVYEHWGMNEEGEKVLLGELKEVKFWSKPLAADLLGKHLKLWNQLTEGGREISALLQAILLEVDAERKALKGPRTEEAEWEPLPAEGIFATPPPDPDAPEAGQGALW